MCGARSLELFEATMANHFEEVYYRGLNNCSTVLEVILVCLQRDHTGTLLVLLPTPMIW